MPENCAALIDQLTMMRHAQGMTQKQLADACGLTQSVVARIESKKSTPTMATFCRLAAALGASLTVVSGESA